MDDLRRLETIWALQNQSTGSADTTEHDMIHRDLKGVNTFLVTARDSVSTAWNLPTPVIGDFGLVCPVSASQTANMKYDEKRQILEDRYGNAGTPGFLAPEVM